MVLVHFILVFLLTSFAVEAAIRPIEPDELQGYNGICHSLSTDNPLDVSLLVASSWTIYYSWNLNLSTCPEVVFRYPTEAVKNRFYSYMHAFLYEEPNWAAAVLEVTMEGRKMLLFDDPNGSSGRFQGVPLFEEHEFDASFQAAKIPLLEMSIKLFDDGKFMVSSSCHVRGGTAFAVRRQGRPKKSEIDSVAASFDFGIRYVTCVNEF